MDWLAGLSRLASSVGPAQWLTITTGLAFLGLLTVLVIQTRAHARHRRELTDLVSGGASDLDELDHSALEGISLSPIDSVFPRQPARFLMLVAIISVGCWIAGYLLAPRGSEFLSSPEWLFQPFYTAAHLIALRLFINVFTRSYAAGVSHLKVSQRQALRGIRPILGPWGALGAAVIAVPFCWFDFAYLFTDRYTTMGRDGVVRAVDYLMWSIWMLEWFVNAFIWVLLVSFMVKNCFTIRKYPFRAPIDVVLQDKHYRPFLQMSAQGASVVLGFSCVTVLYLYYTGGELTDYLGLGITVTLLVVCFVPPWLVLRDKVDRAVHDETTSLRQGVLTGGGGQAAVLGLSSHAGAAVDRSLEHRLDEALALLRIWHLQNLYGNLGQTEAKAILVRLLAPAATIGWQVFQNYGEMAQKLARMVAAVGGPD